MKSVRRCTLLAGAVLASVALVPQAASAKTVQVKIQGIANNPKDFEDVSAKLTGSFGSGSQGKCCIKLPTVNWTWTFGNSKFKGKVKGVTTAKLQGTKTVGTWKLVKGSGTGSFKGATGGGKIVGNITNGHYTYTGTVTLK